MKRNGVVNTYYAAKERMELNAASDYTYMAPDDGELAKQREITSEEGEWPYIALVMPAYNTPAQYLAEAIESVIQQSYSNWILVISDASDDDRVRKTVKRYDQDGRIRYLKLDENKGISENTNAGIDYILESGEDNVDYIGFMDHDDVLTLDALYHMAVAIKEHCGSGSSNENQNNDSESLSVQDQEGIQQQDNPQDIDIDSTGHNYIYNNTDYQSKFHGPALLYSDEDKMTEIGAGSIHKGETDRNLVSGSGSETDSEIKTSAGQFVYFDPHRKYDFNYDLLLTNNYICRLMLVRADIMRNIRFRSAYDGAQDYDLVLQVVRHIITGVNTPIQNQEEYDYKQNPEEQDADKPGTVTSDAVYQNNTDPRLGSYRVISELEDHIIHVPHILYHWRSHPGSTATNVASKTYAYDAGLSALTDHIRTIYGETVTVSHSKHLGFYNTNWGDIDNIFRLRPEIGAVAGRVIDRHGRMSECIADKDGKWLYAGINKHYAGAFNRFDCAQNVYMADPDHLHIRPELIQLKEICADMRVLSDSLHSQHYLILYLPREL